MNTPLGITFFKKVEIYQTIRYLNNKAKSEKESAGGTPSLWPIGKKILKWTYQGHKHPQSPISEYRLYKWCYKGNDKNLLNELDIKPEDLYLKGTPENKRQDATAITVVQIFKYLDFMGFAKLEKIANTPKDTDKGKTKIIIAREGFLVGEVLYELEYSNLFIRLFNKFSYSLWGLLWGHIGALFLLIISLLIILKELTIVVKHFLCGSF